MTATSDPIRKAFRTVAATSLLVAGIWLGAVTVASPPAGAAQSSCLATAVNVTLHNKTGSSLRLDTTKFGVTNAICAHPGNPAGPNSVTHFEVGDNLFKTEMNAAYVAPNNDTIALQASSGYDGVESPHAHCTVVPNGNTPSPYRCTATVHTQDENRGALLGLASTRVTKVDWEILGP